jgi:hypothetical protein
VEALVDNKADKRTIVVGDWVVDDYWFLAEHQSDLSSHVGVTHYRSAANRDDKVVDLCGAGHVARVLGHLQGSNKTLIGIGRWNSADTAMLRHLLHTGRLRASSNQGDQPHNCEAGVDPFVLHDKLCRSSSPTLVTLDPDAPTDRVIRQYVQAKQGWVQLSRIDFQRQEPYEANEQALEVAEIASLGADSVDSIIVHDLDRGTVTRPLVEELLNRFPAAYWYIRAKAVSPNWLNERIRNRLRLVVVGPEVISKHDPFARLLSRTSVEEAAHYPSEIALQLLAAQPNVDVALLTSRREVIVRLGDALLWGVAGVAPTEPEQVGWGSGMMAALIWGLRKADEHLDDNAKVNLVANALTAADNMLWNLPIPTRPSRPMVPVRVYEPARPAEFAPQAATGVPVQGGELQLWRACPQLPGYVTCITEKRDRVEQIGQRIRGFIGATQRRSSLSIAIQADPGSGKSSLVNSLASVFGLEVVRSSIAALNRREELCDLFDEVATTQAKSQRPVMVFVDEINAPLETGPVYSSFLAPLDDLTYRRSTRVFALKPCIWLFAGTHEHGESPAKYSDFRSRLTARYELDYASLREYYRNHGGVDQLEDEARREQVYIGAMAIRSAHPSTRRVEERVLNLLWGLPPESTPARKIIRAAQNLHNVQGGHVGLSNFDGSSFEEIEAHSKAWASVSQLPAGEMVALVSNPPEHRYREFDSVVDLRGPNAARRAASRA